MLSRLHYRLTADKNNLEEDLERMRVRLEQLPREGEEKLSKAEARIAELELTHQNLEKQRQVCALQDVYFSY